MTIEGACIYCIWLDQKTPERNFKVGYSRALLSRLPAIQTGCPFPIKEISFFYIGPGADVRRVENSIHRALSAFRTSGEWFQMDVTNPEHKRIFNQAIAQATTNQSVKWMKTRPEVVKQAKESVKNEQIRKFLEAVAAEGGRATLSGLGISPVRV